MAASESDRSCNPLFGKQRAGDLVLVGIQHAGAKTLGAARLAAQAVELIEHFFGCRIERSRQASGPAWRAARADPPACP